MSWFESAVAGTLFSTTWTSTILVGVEQVSESLMVRWEKSQVVMLIHRCFQVIAPAPRPTWP